VLAKPDALNGQVNPIWIACGRRDTLFERNESLHSLLESKGIQHSFVPNEGNHTFTYWRQNLTDLAPLLFRRASKR
jgi:enterochelin esterase-like enzyme